MDGEDHGLLDGVLSSLHFMQAFSEVLDLLEVHYRRVRVMRLTDGREPRETIFDNLERLGSVLFVPISLQVWIHSPSKVNLFQAQNLLNYKDPSYFIEKGQHWFLDLFEAQLKIYPAHYDSLSDAIDDVFHLFCFWKDNVVVSPDKEHAIVLRHRFAVFANVLAWFVLHFSDDFLFSMCCFFDCLEFHENRNDRLIVFEKEFLVDWGWESMQKLDWDVSNCQDSGRGIRVKEWNCDDFVMENFFYILLFSIQSGWHFVFAYRFAVYKDYLAKSWFWH